MWAKAASAGHMGLGVEEAQDALCRTCWARYGWGEGRRFIIMRVEGRRSRGCICELAEEPWRSGRLIQQAGPRAALGRVKFDFPNPYAVYLHDTPLKGSFSLPQLTTSHGY